MKIKNQNERRGEMNNYNLIYIQSFEKIHLPKIISVRKFLFKKLIDNPELSEEVIKTLRESSEDVLSVEDVVYKKGIDAYTAEVYFDSYVDLTADVLRSINHPDIRNLLILLLNSSKRSVMVKNLLSLPGFNPIETQNGKIGLSFYDFTKKNDTMKQCKVGLNIIKDGYSNRQD